MSEYKFEKLKYSCQVLGAEESLMFDRIILSTGPKAVEDMGLLVGPHMELGPGTWSSVGETENWR